MCVIYIYFFIVLSLWFSFKPNSWIFPPLRSKSANVCSGISLSNYFHVVGWVQSGFSSSLCSENDGGLPWCEFWWSGVGRILFGLVFSMAVSFSCPPLLINRCLMFGNHLPLRLLSRFSSLSRELRRFPISVRLCRFIVFVSGLSKSKNPNLARVIHVWFTPMKIEILHHNVVPRLAKNKPSFFWQFGCSVAPHCLSQAIIGTAAEIQPEQAVYWQSKS